MPDIDEDILRELMVRSTDDLFAAPAATANAIRRQRRRRVRTRALSVTATAAVAGLAVGVVTSASGASGGARLGGHHRSAAPGIRLTAAQHALFSLSAAAAATPRKGGRYVELKEKSIYIEYEPGGTREVGPKASVIDTLTGAVVTYQDFAVSGQRTAQPPAVLRNPAGSMPTQAQLDALPTGTAALRAALLAQVKQQQEQEQREIQQKLGKMAGYPRPRFRAAKSTVTNDDMVFSQATDLLWQPDLSPALRSAVYKVLASTPGVIVKTDVKDSAGRPAMEISRYEAASKDNVETFEDPATGGTLESAWVEQSGSGTVFMADVYQSTSYTSTIPPDPYQG